MTNVMVPLVAAIDGGDVEVDFAAIRATAHWQQHVDVRDLSLACAAVHT